MAESCNSHGKLLTVGGFATARRTTRTVTATGSRMSTHESMKDQCPDSGEYSGQKYEKWSENLTNLRNFLETHKGRYPTKQENPSLYAWVASQRNARRVGRLNANQINTLEQFGFISNKQDYEWQNTFAQYCQFLLDNGGRDPSQRCPDEPEHTLAVWLLGVRRSYRKGTIKPDREKKLKSIGFRFEPMDEEWRNAYERLRDYKRKHLTWPTANEDDGKKLVAWLNFQARAYARGTMSEEKRELLDELDFQSYREREPAADLAWRENFRRVAAYRSEHGHLPKSKTWITSAEKTEIDQMCSWLTTQRDKYAEGTLEDRQIESLNSIGFEFRKLQIINIEKWETQFSSIRTFLETHQREPRDSGHDQHERSLGKWLRYQRMWFNGKTRNAKYDPNKALRLKDIGIDLRKGPGA